MRRSPETPIKAMLGDTLIAALGLCALALSPLATAGVTSLCDSRPIVTPDLDIHPGELMVDLIDVDEQAVIDLDVSIDIDAMALPSPRGVDAMLEQMFDLYGVRELPLERTSSPSASLPLTDLSAPAITTETPVAGSASEGPGDYDSMAPAVSTRVPGLSEDDLRRYRSKMYRTDI